MSEIFETQKIERSINDINKAIKSCDERANTVQDKIDYLFKRESELKKLFSVICELEQTQQLLKNFNKKIRSEKSNSSVMDSSHNTNLNYDQVQKKVETLFQKLLEAGIADRTDFEDQMDELNQRKVKIPYLKNSLEKEIKTKSELENRVSILQKELERAKGCLYEEHSDLTKMNDLSSVINSGKKSRDIKELSIINLDPTTKQNTNVIKNEDLINHLDDDPRYKDNNIDENKDIDVDINKDIDDELDEDIDDELDEDIDEDIDDELDEDIDEELDEDIDDELDEDIDEELDEDIDDELDEELDEDIDDELDEDIDEELDEDIDDELDEELDEDIDDELDEELDENIDDELDEELDEELDDELYDELDDLDEEINEEMDKDLDEKLEDDIVNDIDDDISTTEGSQRDRNQIEGNGFLADSVLLKEIDNLTESLFKGLENKKLFFISKGKMFSGFSEFQSKLLYKKQELKEFEEELLREKTEEKNIKCKKLRATEETCLKDREAEISKEEEELRGRQEEEFRREEELLKKRQEEESKHLAEELLKKKEIETSKLKEDLDKQYEKELSKSEQELEFIRSELFKKQQELSDLQEKIKTVEKEEFYTIQEELYASRNFDDEKSFVEHSLYNNNLLNYIEKSFLDSEEQMLNIQNELLQDIEAENQLIVLKIMNIKNVAKKDYINELRKVREMKKETREKLKQKVIEAERIREEMLKQIEELDIAMESIKTDIPQEIKEAEKVKLNAQIKYRALSSDIEEKESELDKECNENVTLFDASRNEVRAKKYDKIIQIENVVDEIKKEFLNKFDETASRLIDKVSSEPKKVLDESNKILDESNKKESVENESYKHLGRGV